MRFFLLCPQGRLMIFFYTFCLLRPKQYCFQLNSISLLIFLWGVCCLEKYALQSQVDYPFRTKKYSSNRDQCLRRQGISLSLTAKLTEMDQKVTSQKLKRSKKLLQMVKQTGKWDKLYHNRVKMDKMRKAKKT